MKRRQILAYTGGIVALLPLAGCGGVTGPNPEIMDQSVEGSLFGQTDFEILIRNEGQEGNILVTVETFDNNDQKLNSASKKTHFQADETKQVTVSMRVSSQAEYWEASIEAL